MPQPGAGASHISSKAVRTARCTGWSTSTYSAPPPSRRFSVRKPACLPEQLLCSWLGRRSSARRRCRSGASSGTCGPQRRSGSPRPSSASQAATRVTCIAAPVCEAQASASCSRGQAVAGAALEQRQRLQHLAGGARQDHRLRVAPGGADHRRARRRPPRGRGGATRRCRRARPRPSSPHRPSSRPLRQIVAQYAGEPAEREPDPRLDRAERQALAGGDLGVAEPLVEGGDQDRALLGRQAGERRAQPPLALGGAQRREAVGLGVGLEQRVERVGAGAAGAAQEVDAPVAGDGEDPGRGGGARSGRRSRRGARPPPSRPGRSRRHRRRWRRRAS